MPTKVKSRESRAPWSSPGKTAWGRLRAGLAGGVLVATGCGEYVVRAPPSKAFDAVLVPGCPSERDGSPSYCQLGRGGQAAILWRDGWAKNFIVSGSDVHSPYVEAEAIAQVMTTLGVPPDRIILERDALHTDENVYYSILLADKLGYETMAVVSTELAASWMCKLMVRWGRPCSAVGMNLSALEAFMPPYGDALRSLRAPRVDPWTDIGVRESKIHAETGHWRPPSFVLYPLYGSLVRSYRPIPPHHPEPQTWAQRLEELASHSSL
jgi:hypothetical protein